MTTSSSHRLDYHLEPSHRWPVLLDGIRRSGASRVSAFVPWGAHEKTPGARDFSSVPRLQLERFMGLVHERELRLEIRFGFLPIADTFPQWAQGAERKSLVPRVLWDPDLDDFAFSEIPSPADPAVRGAFLEFCDELLALVSLYARDQSPIDSLRLDLGLVQADVGVLAESQFDGLLRARYPSIDALNRHYGTSLKDFSPLGRRSGIRLLLDRRPWLACFDYKWCRAHSAAAIWEGVRQAAARHHVESILYAALDSEESSVPNSAAWEIAFDPVHVDRVGRGAFPFLPEGLVCKSSLQAFRLWEALGERAARWGCRLTRLPLWDESRGKAAPLIVVAAGKYLPEAAFAWLGEHTQNGGRVLFPFGAARYDESMRCHDWSTPWLPTKFRVDGHSLQKLAVGSGTLWTCSPPLLGTEDSLELIPRLVECVNHASERQDP